MKKLNVVIVYNNEDKILMCKREKDPYKGKFNFVGGKVEENEDDLDAAYRELEEETNIPKEAIKLIHLMSFLYYTDDIELQIYFGRLNEVVELKEEVNSLYWFDKSENFFDLQKFAGEGDVGTMINKADAYIYKLLNKESCK